MQARCSWSAAFVASLAIALALPVPAAGFFLPDTNQTRCFRGVFPFSEIPCRGSGQDGAYGLNPPSYSDNGDGTATDNSTGLMWQEEHDGTQYNWYQASGTYEAFWNPDTMSVCGSLALGGFDDWRLPTISEIVGIMDFSSSAERVPVVNAAYFPNTQYSLLSSDTDASEPRMAWETDFREGMVRATWKDSPSFVLCVRGTPWSGPSLVNNRNGTVTDRSTGLIWQRGHVYKPSWGEALTYCKGLKLGESASWRLPNVKELQSLMDYAKTRPAVDPTMFPQVGYGYWSSTSAPWNPVLTFPVGLYWGSVEQADKIVDGQYVRCVRGGKDGLSSALDTKLKWKTGSEAPWFAQTHVTHDGVDAGRSGQIADGGTSFLQAAVVGPKTISFWWKTASEEGDKLTFSVDGTQKGVRSGVNDWQRGSFRIPSGTHVVKWVFSRDGGGSAGLDAAFVDQVRISRP